MVVCVAFLNVRKTFIDLEFSSGIHINIYQEHLIAGEGRKNLRSLRYKSAIALESLTV
ncbi:MAG: hypothetical protein ACJARZ_001646 [Dokdonia sp.]|jgi:hypothetical protein